MDKLSPAGSAHAPLWWPAVATAIAYSLPFIASLAAASVQPGGTHLPCASAAPPGSSPRAPEAADLQVPSRIQGMPLPRAQVVVHSQYWGCGETWYCPGRYGENRERKGVSREGTKAEVRKLGR